MLGVYFGTGILPTFLGNVVSLSDQTCIVFCICQKVLASRTHSDSDNRKSEIHQRNEGLGSQTQRSSTNSCSG